MVAKPLAAQGSGPAQRFGCSLAILVLTLGNIVRRGLEHRRAPREGSSAASASATSDFRWVRALAGPNTPTSVALPAAASLPADFPRAAALPSTSSKSSAIWKAWPSAEP